MARGLLGVIGVLHILNGIFMMVAPQLWYDTIPGVPMTGPFNVHFVRDISMIFMGSGGLFLAAIWRGVPAYAIAGALWPAAHAVYHIQIWVMMRGMPFDDVALVNLTGIQLPAWLGLYAAFRLSSEMKDAKA